MYSRAVVKSAVTMTLLREFAKSSNELPQAPAPVIDGSKVIVLGAGPTPDWANQYKFEPTRMVYGKKPKPSLLNKLLSRVTK